MRPPSEHTPGLCAHEYPGWRSLAGTRAAVAADVVADIVAAVVAVDIPADVVADLVVVVDVALISVVAAQVAAAVAIAMLGAGAALPGANQRSLLPIVSQKFISLNIIRNFLRHVYGRVHLENETTVVATKARDRETWYLLKISRTFVRKLSNF